MKVFVYPNVTAKRYLEKLNGALERLEEKHECVMREEDSFKIFGDDSRAGDIEGCEMVVSLGGDGTFLRAAQIALENNLPICGINCGRLGHLCRYRLEDEYDLDLGLVKNVPTLEFMLDGKKHYAINDVVVGKDYFGGTVELSVDVKGKESYCYLGDGLIVSTYLGSTGYTKSAGGITLSDDADNFVVTPICPTVETPSFLVNDNDEVGVKLLSKNYTATIFVDGTEVGALTEILVKRGDKDLLKL